MSWLWFVVIVIIVVAAGILIYLAIWGNVNASQTDSTQFAIPLQPPVDFLYACANLECQSGLVCDSTYGVCKLPGGSPCNQGSQCLTGLVCSGLCVGGTPAAISGNPNDPCPCPQNMTCAAFSLNSQLRTCKLNGDEFCVQSTDCLSGQCQNGFCSPGLPDGSPCQANVQCLNQNCSLGWCQEQDRITGQEGAICTLNGAPPCDAGLGCLVPGTGTIGVCGQPSLGLSSSCTTTDPQNVCSQPLFCNNIDTGAGCQVNEICLCQYFNNNDLQPDPNGCVSQCTTGFTCTDGQCLGDLGQACTSGPQCQSGVCGANGIIYRGVYSFFNLDTNLVDTTTTPSAALGSFTVSWTPVFTNVLANATRLTYNTGSAGQDIVYYVIPGSSATPLTTGVIRADTNANVAPGFITNANGSFTLKDAVMGQTPETSLIVYNQVSGSTSGDVIYDLTGQPYNPTPGAAFPGTQYSGGVALNISSFDVTPTDDVLIVDTDGNLYVKPGGQQFYTLARNNQGVTLGQVSFARFYSDISQSITVDSCADCPTSTCNATSLVCQLNSPSYLNLGYVASDPVYGDIVQFTGNLEGSLYPVYDPTRGGGSGDPSKFNTLSFSSYSDPVAGITGGTLIIVATNQANFQTNVFLTPGGGVQAVPGYVDGSSLVLGSTSALYLYSPRSCQS